MKKSKKSSNTVSSYAFGGVFNSYLNTDDEVDLKRVKRQAKKRRRKAKRKRWCRNLFGGLETCGRSSGKSAN
ncbi:MAG: hypothetical protein ACXABD_17035 [Candidatus Thorarchaeota archaeon]|jgi:hypothetical protein